MSTLLLFYPENDLALADNTANYTAPRAAVDMRVAGEQLPLWYGKAGDVVYMSGTNGAWFDAVTHSFDIQADLWHGQDIDSVRPWGWSHAVKRYFERLGVSDGILPSAEQIERIRALSHRAMAGHLSQYLRDELGDIIAPRALEVTDIEQVHDFVATNGRTLVKLPWSGSGRGIIDTVLVPEPEFSRRTVGSIHRQGSVMLERYYSPHYDFALLFEMRVGRAHFSGYSLFFTDARGMYVGNLVAEEDILRDELSRHADFGLTDSVIPKINTWLTDEIGRDYEGPLGVDMMVVGDGDCLAVAEINLRNTMGHVAHALAERYLAPGMQGQYTVLPNDGSPFGLPHPGIVSNGRLTSGTIDLTPGDGRFRFRLEVLDA